MRKAEYYQKKENNLIQCILCPRNCLIKQGGTGICGVRENIFGELFLGNYGKISAVNLDPIEKKPLYHFFPGKKIYSIGSYGCNMKCLFCQNCEISQREFFEEFLPDLKEVKISDVVAAAKRLKTEGNIGIAYTYNEPTVFFEYMIDTAIEITKAGMKNVVVSNGYINEEPLRELVKYTDAFNIDLKGFNERFYREITAGSLKEVMHSLEIIKKSGKHLEITNLVIPGLNDDENEIAEMAEWIAGTLGRDTVLHISKYFPRYKMNIPATDENIMLKLYNTASRYLDFVYLGNIRCRQSDTICPKCGNLAVSRNGYDIDACGIDKKGQCVRCGLKII